MPGFVLAYHSIVCWNLNERHSVIWFDFKCVKILTFTMDFFIVSLHILFLFYLAFVKIDVFLRVRERIGWELCVRLRSVLKDVLCNASCICCSHAWAELWLLTLTLAFPSIHIYLYTHVYLCTHSHALSLGTFQSHFLY